MRKKKKTKGFGEQDIELLVKKQQEELERATDHVSDILRTLAKRTNMLTKTMEVMAGAINELYEDRDNRSNQGEQSNNEGDDSDNRV